MMRLLRILVMAAFAAAAVSPPALAVQPDEMLANPQLEQRARALSRELRCMVCQNQSIDESDAPLARDLRILVRERLKAGDTDTQALDFLVDRYGQFVLLKPRFEWQTAVLWLTPIVALLVGIAGNAFALRRSRLVPAAAAPLSEEEERRLRDLMTPERSPFGADKP